MSDPDLYEWLALRRVHNGGVAKSAGAYLDHGRPTPGHLAEVFDRLIWTGLVTVADGDALWELRRLSLTDTGQARLVEHGGAVPKPHDQHIDVGGQHGLAAHLRGLLIPRGEIRHVADGVPSPGHRPLRCVHERPVDGQLA